MSYEDDLNGEIRKFLKSRLKNVDTSTIKNLKCILNQNGCWENVVHSIPTSFSSKISETLINEKARLHNETPANVFFNELNKRNARVIDLIPWLESCNLDQALMLLKPDEPLQIIKQPPKKCHVQNVLNLSCQAKGFPTPKYQWYKDNNELLEHTFSDINMKGVTSEHEGIYFCKVFNIDRLTNEEKQHVFSSATIVTVETNSKAECLKIYKHPVSPATKVKQGCSVILKCLAKCGSSPIKYQWYENGKKMLEEKESSLKLNDLKPIDGVSRWYYTCEASLKHSSVMSKEAKIILDEANDDTQYYAKRKLALLIGNQDYQSLPKLTLTIADVLTLSYLLEDKGFTVFSFQNLTLTEMRNVVEMFTEFVEKGDYVIFYYAGHGFEEIKHYMIPVEAGEDYLTADSLTVELVLEKLQNKNPALALMLVDMCLVQPDRIATVTLSPSDSMRSNEDSNTLIAFATSPKAEALEYPKHKNGVFMEHLKKYVSRQKFIVDILFEVKRDMDLLKQSPWTSGNLSKRLTLDDPCLDSSVRVKLDTLLSNFGNLREHSLNFNGFNVHMCIRKHKKVFLNAIDVFMEIESLNNDEIKKPLLVVTLKDQGTTIPGIKLIKEECPQWETKYTIINLQREQREIILVVALLLGKSCQVQRINLGMPLIVKEGFWINKIKS